MLYRERRYSSIGKTCGFILCFILIFTVALGGIEIANAQVHGTDDGVSPIPATSRSFAGDGVYEAQGKGFDASGAGNLFTSTTVSNNAITDIQILRHRKFFDNQQQQEKNFNDMAQLVIATIIQQQKTTFTKTELQSILADLLKSMGSIEKNQCVEDAAGIAESVNNAMTAEANNEKQIFFDPKAGNDDFDGLTGSNAVETFDRAKSLLPNGGKIVLMDKWTIKKGETIHLESPSGASIILERQAGFLKDMVVVNGTMTMKDITVDGHGSITSAGSSILVSSFENSTGKLIMEDGAVIQNNISLHSGAGIYVSNDGEVEIKGGIIQNNTTYDRGGGLCVDSCNVTMSGGTIKNNKALLSKGNDTGSGGGIVNIGSTGKGFILKDGEVTGNYAQRRGGAIAGSYQIFKMYGGTIAENSSENGSGGISDVGHYWNTTLLLYGGSIERNTGNAPGVDLHEENTMKLSGGIKVRENTAGDETANISCKIVKITDSLTGEVHFYNDDGTIEGGADKSGDPIYKLIKEDEEAIFHDQGLRPVLQESGNKIFFLSASDQGIKINKDYIHMAVGDTLTLTAKSEPEIPGDTMKWSIDNDSILSITQDGKIKALKKGRTTVRVTNSVGKTATCRVIVVSPKLPSNLQQGIYTGISKHGGKEHAMKIQLYVKNGKIYDIRIAKHKENIVEKKFAETFIDGILHYYTLDRPFLKGHKDVCIKVTEAIEEALTSQPYDPKPLQTVYLDPKDGDDSSFGYSEKEAVKTFEKAQSLAVEKGKATILVMSPIIINEKTTLDSKSNMRSITLKRHKKSKEAMIQIHHASLSLKNIVLDGNKKEAGSCKALLHIARDNSKKDFSVNIEKDVTLTNAMAKDATVISCNHPLCSVIMKGGKFIRNEASAGSLISISKGEFRMTDGVITKNVTKEGIFKNTASYGTVSFRGTPRITGNQNKYRKLNPKNIFLYKLSLCGPLKKGALLVLENPHASIKGAKFSTYDKKAYTIKKSDLKHIKHLHNLMPRLNKKATVSFSVKAPTIKTKVTKGKVKISWKSVSGTIEYRIYKNGKLIKKVDGSKRKYTVAIKLRKNKKATIKVIGIGKNGKPSPATVKKVKGR